MLPTLLRPKSEVYVQQEGLQKGPWLVVQTAPSRPLRQELRATCKVKKYIYSLSYNQKSPTLVGLFSLVIIHT